MSNRPKIRITLIDRKGPCGCHRGHKIGDSFDFDTERGQLCPMAMHVAFPYIDILRYGGSIPNQPEGTAVFCCPDVDTINVFKIENCKTKPDIPANEYPALFCSVQHFYKLIQQKHIDFSVICFYNENR